MRSIDVTGNGGVVAVRICSLESYLHQQALLTSRSISQPWSYQISFVESKVTSPKSLNSPPSNPLSSSVDTEASLGCVFTHENRGEETKVHKL
ncbi:unnamed protein product [Brassica rapa]|uniref:Uncharacterized protein n=2 Tax=Brassica TaxID=3705 RepID=A0A8D9LVD7_BRACM|nr:unnamed protein product [Brassica napus]CAG7888307.1 unnamed protein product [Brassica rapa]